MPEVAFVMSPNQSWFFREFVDTLEHELSKQGVPSSFHADGFPEPTPERVYALVAPHEFVALETEDALPDEALLKRAIFICATQPGGVQIEQEIELSRRAGAVFNINSHALPEFRRAGIPARHLRLGYSSLRDCFDPDRERDIDVLFLGALTRRRTKYLAACAQVLASYDCCLVLSDNSRPNSGASATFVAESKWDLLSRAKIVLNIHQDDRLHFEWLRALDAIHAGAVVVTEHSGGMAPLVAGEHLLAGTPESLPSVLDAALRDAGELGRMRAAAYEQIRASLPLAISASALRAAAAELTGRPAPPGASVGRRLTSKSRLPSRWFPASSREANPEAGAIRRGLQEVGLDLIEMRRQVARLEQLVRTGNKVPPGSEVLYESPTWGRRDDPRVTVVTVLYNHSERIGEALDSVAASRLREFELIVVDDGSSDSSRETATEWLAAHAWIPAQLIGHGISRGPGAARNTAVDAARAPYCFVLGAANEVYPRCLDVLAWTLGSLPEVAFVYPITEVFGIDALVRDSTAFLQNAFGWQPERLRLGNYIETPWMIRVDRLRELGGFTTDGRLNGWEDYDLWCRMAERGWAGQIVRQILARRRALLNPLVSTISLSETIATAAIIERAPDLMGGIQLSRD